MKLLDRLLRRERLRLLILTISDRCDQRCTHCGIWERIDSKHGLTLDEWLRVADEAMAGGVEAALFTGGEPLLSPNLWPVAEHLRQAQVRSMLATNGMLLERYADEVGRCFAEVYVSLEGASPSTHDSVRGTGTFDRTARGVSAVQSRASSVLLTARATLRAGNLHEVEAIIDTARDLGFHHVSFLPLDAHSSAFGGTSETRRAQVPTPDQVDALDAAIDALERSGALRGGFVLEDAEKLHRLARHLRASGSSLPFERPDCDAPWWSSVVEHDGSVRPCFFHDAVGNARDGLGVVRDSGEYQTALARISDPNATCDHCVCPKKGWTKTKVAPLQGTIA